MRFKMGRQVFRMQNRQDLTGKRFGKLTVLHKTQEKEKGYYVWLCQCDCGRTIKVNTKRLTRGTITDCGCVPKKYYRNGTIAEDITGQRFGKLVAIKRVSNTNGRTAWECRCDCGNIHIVSTRLLKEGKCKSCGCLHRTKYRGMNNIAGKRFGRLTAEYPLDRRDKKGSIYWHCKCDCGNEIDVTEDGLVHGNYKSCGCFKKEIIWKNIPKQLHFIDGTCLEILEKRKHRADNKSGFRGVYRQKNGKYLVTIGFKGKKYYIATTKTLEDAIRERLNAEQMIHDGFVAAYYKWMQEMQNVPEEERIPLIFDVEKVNGEFVVHTNINDKRDS